MVVPILSMHRVSRPLSVCFSVISPKGGDGGTMNHDTYLWGLLGIDAFNLVGFLRPEHHIDH